MLLRSAAAQGENTLQRRDFFAAGLAALSFGSDRLDSTSVTADAPLRPGGAPKPADRAEATAIVANARKIGTPNGVERLEAVRIGGIEKWVSIRGADRYNPALLFIHGGPGYVSMPMSWWFTRGWEEYFTVVQWDQRGAGKTYLLNDRKAVAPTMTRERMVQDAEEMAAWLR